MFVAPNAGDVAFRLHNCLVGSASAMIIQRNPKSLPLLLEVFSIGIGWGDFRNIGPGEPIGLPGAEIAFRAVLIGYGEVDFTTLRGAEGEMREAAFAEVILRGLVAAEPGRRDRGKTFGASKIGQCAGVRDARIEPHADDFVAVNLI